MQIHWYLIQIQPILHHDIALILLHHHEVKEIVSHFFFRTMPVSTYLFSLQPLCCVPLHRVQFPFPLSP